MKTFLFILVVFLTNTIQGITGFAGTILAMPFCLMLLGYALAKPVLNVLGLLAGLYIFLGNRKSVNVREFLRIAVVMAVTVVAGILVKGYNVIPEKILYILFGGFVVILALWGLWKLWRNREETPEISGDGTAGTVRKMSILDIVQLCAAGIIHGMFVSGGPLVVSYLARRIPEKQAFRATISTVWIVLNTIILIGDVQQGLWNRASLLLLAETLPLFLGGMFLGGILVKYMNQRYFMILTYVLLVVSGVSLILK